MHPPLIPLIPSGLLTSGTLATLTDEEIAAIDEAGAKGPPSSILTKLRRNPLAWVVFGLVQLFVGLNGLRLYWYQ